MRELIRAFGTAVQWFCWALAGETKFVVEQRVVWPKDKDGNIIRPSWWVDD